ncbi:MAG: MlaA family lipoprotein [Desulfuromonadales bacterium]|jgi:phospholipid-binding lipoprotein MlaA
MRLVVPVSIFLLLFCTVSGTFGKAAGDFAGQPSGGEFQDPFEPAVVEEIDDPLEPLNRAAFWLNDKMYTRIFTPLCQAATPEWRRTVTSICTLFNRPISVGAVELEFKFRDGGSEVGRFVMHTVLDWLQQVDPETTRGLKDGEEDFGKTLETVGVGSGCYLVLPVIGPSSLRDGVGRLAGFYLDPPPQMDAPATPENRSAAPRQSLLAQLKTYESIRRHSLDPYLFFRDAYSQQLAGSDHKPIFSFAPRPVHRSSGEQMASVPALYR